MQTQTVKKRIVVVEDEDTLLHAISFTLKRSRYSVAAFTDGLKALEYIEDLKSGGKSFDLLITDIQLPGLNGIDLVGRLTRIFSNIPVLAITGFGDKAMVVELLRRGCTDYMDKPFSLKDLVRRVTALIEKRKQNQL